MSDKRYDDDFEWIPYARISDDREGRGLGAARQVKDIRVLCGQLGGRILEPPCVDNDLTAYDKSTRYKPRPEYERLCELLRERPGRRGVLTWHTDRLHRTPRELEDFIDLIEATGAPVHTVRAGVIDLSTASGRMTARVHCAVARHESEHKGERIRAKVVELAEAGKIGNGGPRPFGFRRVYAGEGQRRKILRDELDPVEAEVVRECARRLLRGESVRSVTNWLNDSGVPTSTGRRWAKQAVRYMMRAGRIAGLREHKDKVVGPAVWPAIITVEEHEQLRALLDSHERAPGNRVRQHYLTGRVFCSRCVEHEVKMGVGRQHGVLKFKCPADVGCNGRVIALANLEDLVGRYVVARLGDSRFLAQLAARERTDDIEAEALVGRLEADERRLAKLKTAIEADDADEDEIPELVAAARTIRRRIADVRAQLAQRAGVPGVVRDAVGITLEEFSAYTLDTKRTILGFLVDRIVIGPGVPGRKWFDPNRVDIVPAHHADPEVTSRLFGDTRRRR
ncbi:MAG TPA: recombinase family protein [Micromonosporaceae bacterium]|nr:recombinase family protein [Micromonosporaceae bacterium]